MIHVTASAPGKIILFGEHAVVQGKTAIATGLSLRTKVIVTENMNDELLLDLPDLPEFGKQKYTLDTFRKFKSFKEFVETNDSTQPSECNQKFLEDLSTIVDIKGIHTFLFLFCYITKCKRGFNISCNSELPIGSGLGSSASFCVGMCAALLKALNVRACKNCQECTGNVPCLRQLLLINEWSLQGEKIMHGSPSGIDNAVSTLGRALSFTRKDGYKTLHNIPPLKILITDSKVSRSAKTLVERVINRQKQFSHLIDPVSDLIDLISLDCLKSFNSFQEDKDSKALETKMELLFDMNHALLNGCYGVGHKSIDKIVKITKDYGLHSKITGAGGGGCVISLINKNIDTTQLESLKKRLEKSGYTTLEATIGDIGVSFE